MSDEERLREIAKLLEELRDNQKTQLERQGEALAIQKKQFELFLQQHDKTVAIQNRAESIQDRSAQLVAGVRRLFPVIVGVLVLLILYVTWLLFRLKVL
jgi:hypothetical protein